MNKCQTTRENTTEEDGNSDKAKKIYEWDLKKKPKKSKSWEFKVCIHTDARQHKVFIYMLVVLVSISLAIK